jgi:hypothetical protein
VVAGMDQSRLLGAQSVVVFQAVGPTANGLPLFGNCAVNSISPAAKAAVVKATDQWWKVGECIS